LSQKGRRLSAILVRLAPSSYGFIEKPGGRIEVLSRSLLDGPGVETEMSAVSARLDALPMTATDPAGIAAEIRAINALSDARFSDEPILRERDRTR
jgi:hypothetical protein